jgi:hypothetical protein
MVNALINEPDDRVGCPYFINFESTPAPAEELNSLESGRLMLTVKLEGTTDAKVDAVAVKLVNRVKEKNLGKTRPASTLKRQALVTATLLQDKRRPRRWAGTVSIPVTWTEGGTRTYERTGASTPKGKGDIYALDITYRLQGGRNCTTHLVSDDVFHWKARRKLPLDETEKKT